MNESRTWPVWFLLVVALLNLCSLSFDLVTKTKIEVCQENTEICTQIEIWDVDLEKILVNNSLSELKLLYKPTSETSR